LNPAAAQSVTSPPLFFDLFEDPDGGWTSYEDSSVAFSYKAGTYRMEARRADSVWWSWAPIETSIKRFVATFSVEIESGGGGEYGLVWGASDDDLYLLRVSPDGWFAVDRFRSGTWSSVVSPTLSDAIAPGENRVQVVVDGSALLLTINSETVAGYRLPDEFDSVRVGFAAATIGASGFAASFDNLKVYELDERVELTYYTDFAGTGAAWGAPVFETTGAGYRDSTYAIWANIADWFQWSGSPIGEAITEPFAVECTGFRHSGADAHAVYGIYWSPSSDPDGDTYYFFRVTASGEYAIEHYRNGSYLGALHATSYATLLQTGETPNRLRLTVSNSQATVAANGVPMETVSLPDVGPFWVGLAGGSWGADGTPAEVRFTRFAVYQAAAQ